MIKVVREQDGLNRQVWRFDYVDNECVLRVSGYEELNRPTKRHNYTCIKKFVPWEQGCGKMTRADIPLPDNVAAEALQQFVAKIKVVRG